MMSQVEWRPLWYLAKARAAAARMPSSCGEARDGVVDVVGVGRPDQPSHVLAEEADVAEVVLTHARRQVIPDRGDEGRAAYAAHVGVRTDGTARTAPKGSGAARIAADAITPAAIVATGKTAFPRSVRDTPRTAQTAAAHRDFG